MRGVSSYAVIYDISSDKERGKVDKLLKGFGFRVQKSVFECVMRKRERDELISRLKKLDLKSGFVKVYRIEYSSKREVIGKKMNDDIDEHNAFII